MWIFLCFFSPLVDTYISAFCMHTTAQANLCSSPPLRSSTFLSRTFWRSKSSQILSWIFSSSFLSSMAWTVPFTARGIWSTYWGLMHAYMKVQWTKNSKILCMFRHYFQVIFEDFCEIILQLRSSEVCQNFRPIWRALYTQLKTSPYPRMNT